jgi:hypothetical protein
LTDNVYADSQPSDPLGKLGKHYIDADSQVTKDDFAKIISRKGDFVLIGGAGEKMSPRGKKRGHRNKHRGRKNQYYTQIDAEDDQEAENMETEMNMGADIVHTLNNNMGIIREVEEPPAKVASAKKKTVKINEEREAKQMAEQKALDQQMKKIE